MHVWNGVCFAKCLFGKMINKYIKYYYLLSKPRPIDLKLKIKQSTSTAECVRDCVINCHVPALISAQCDYCFK